MLTLITEGFLCPLKFCSQGECLPCLPLVAILKLHYILACGV